MPRAQFSIKAIEITRFMTFVNSDSGDWRNGRRSILLPLGVHVGTHSSEQARDLSKKLKSKLTRLKNKSKGKRATPLSRRAESPATAPENTLDGFSPLVGYPKCKV